ncbi:MAG: hypothetical protein EKK64_03610 [Neisseriaceae bacterium]|nr:MAG: hypothetical protein EKK64_03610 [Neisseriaceae bacterium]
MKKIYFGGILFIFLSLLYNFIINLDKKPIFIKKQTILEKNLKEDEIEKKIKKSIQRINEKNQRVKSIIAENMFIKVNQRTSVSVFGNLTMEKPKNFRLKIWHSITGIEMDIGSNQDIFWFWSKRMNPPILYFSKHENINKTMLKAPLNPIWIMESLGLNSIDLKDKEFKKIEDKWAIIEKNKSSTGELVRIATLIDIERDLILGKYLYNNSFNLIASTEIKTTTIDPNTDSSIPKEILIIWYDENISMECKFSKIHTNLKIKEQTWERPFVKNSLEMGN